jgi:hypothetical protein
MTDGVATNSLFAHDVDRIAPEPPATDWPSGSYNITSLPESHPLEVLGVNSPTFKRGGLIGGELNWRFRSGIGVIPLGT